ncbi:MAG: proline dehydrogenase family protein [Gemmatimonadota bacterium]|nr:proline dehydrogenase family protein [Gemmatimonadota bacterium]
MTIARRILLWGSRNRWLESQMRRRAFARRAVRRFLPGETLADALTAAQALAARGFGTVLTQLGENLASDAEADGVRDHYCEVLTAVEGRDLPAVISVKPTQLGLDHDVDACTARVRMLAEQAAARAQRVWIDMEDSTYVDATLALFRRVHATQRNVGLCLQTYLRRTAADLEALLPLNPAIRLVKGAYAEPPDRAFPRKADVDANFAALGQTLMTHAARTGAPAPVLGTHDIRLVRRLQQVAVDAGLDPQACEVHMLYGIRTAEQEQLLRDGYAVRVLISYGAAWFRWYMRRLAERPANVWFVMRSVVA